jgi:RNA polymerase sigma-70 factor (ECF subfamily)
VSGKLVPLRRVTGATETLSDEALLAACATGDTAALGALFDRFHEVVHRVAARLTGGDELQRDDLVQSTFLAVPRAARSFRGTAQVRTWILGVAANLARLEQRGERRRRARETRYVEEVGGSPASPADEVDRRRRLARVERALADLPRDQQIVFILIDLERLPGAEVASALEIPEGTMWRRLHTARKAIRAACADVEGGSAR